MKDPLTASAVVSGAAAAIGLGHIAGIPVDSLVFGLAGGVVAVLAVPAPKKRNGGRLSAVGIPLFLGLVGSVLVSVLVAAAMGPLTAAYLHMQGVDHALEVRAFSFIWGAGAQAGLLVTAIEALRRRIDQFGGRP
jgi:hypothetical protein